MTAPSATYRLQLHAGFAFDDAAALCDYLSDLGVTHVYCSPYLQAAKGSTHGYDVIDHRRPNAELGGEEALERFMESLRKHGLGQVLDVVPNHMAISTSENRWWADVLENGPSSHFARYFDVEWDPPESRLQNMVLIPVLGDHYGRVLEAREMSVIRDGVHFHIAYSDGRYPISPNSLGQLLGRAAREAESDELAFFADAFAELPRPTATDGRSVRRRHRDIGVLRQQMHRLFEAEPTTVAAVDDAVDAVNRDLGALHALLENQNYRLAWWRRAGRDLGYRRFFDINTLIGLQIEDEQVFADTHQRVLEWVRAGCISGLRIDHPDGLRDPLEYLKRLRGAAPNVWIVVEKILERDEPLPREWPIAGTTGYDFLNRVAGLFVDPAAEQSLTDFYAEFTGEPTNYPRLVHQKKLQILREVLGSDVNRLTDLFLQICERHPRHRDYSRHELTDALREVAAWFPVYRTYVVPSKEVVSAADRRYIDVAVSSALRERPDLEPPLFEFLRDLLTLKTVGDTEGEFVARFQQLTGPAMAKGVEDTVFYTYNRFVLLNEVGGDPSRFGSSLEEFHDVARQSQQRWPLTMVTTATHDTKRGEDMRMRLAVLSEEPEAWIDAVRRWSTMTTAHRTGDLPDRNAEYFFYQALAGAWPVSVERLTAYMQKATREAKVYTSWTSPNEHYDRAMTSFVEGCLGDSAFLRDVCRFVEPLLRFAYTNSLAQTLIKLTAPGVPDLYQGTELWAFNFVDPDNRQPVDYVTRRSLLAEVERLSPATIWERAEEGLPKLWTVTQALQLRARQPGAFGAEASYTPLEARGPFARHVVAFQRGSDVLTIVPRLTRRATWNETTVHLPNGEWRNVLTRQPVVSQEVRLSDLWREFPVALLERLVS
jgi:(1->4)-alpha-D-glucan 1-alpha-D-glucosylmutase